MEGIFGSPSVREKGLGPKPIRHSSPSRSFLRRGERIHVTQSCSPGGLLKPQCVQGQGLVNEGYGSAAEPHFLSLAPFPPLPPSSSGFSVSLLVDILNLLLFDGSEDGVVLAHSALSHSLGSKHFENGDIPFQHFMTCSGKAYKA